MRELNTVEMNEVSGGNAGSYGVGLATSVAIGAAAGPAGVLAAAAVFSISFGLTSLFV